VGHLLHGVRDRREFVGAECRRDENNSRMLDVRGNELPGDFRAVGDVARDDGTTLVGGLTELASVVELGVADLGSADHVDTAGAQDLGNARRQILAQIERHLPVTTRTSPG